MAGGIRLGGGGYGQPRTGVRIATNASQVAISLKEFEEALNYKTVTTSNDVLEWIRKRATEYYMVAGGDAASDPPNPPPGPLKRRSGRLARAVFIIKTYEKYGHVFEGRVEVNSNQAIYGWSHEYGYLLTARQSSRLDKVFEFGKWRRNTHQTGSTKLQVRARPFMAPAMRDAEGYAKFRFDNVLVEARNEFERLR